MALGGSPPTVAVTELTLANHKLQGNLPTELGYLSGVTKNFQLGTNKLYVDQRLPPASHGPTSCCHRP